MKLWGSNKCTMYGLQNKDWCNSAAVWCQSCETFKKSHLTHRCHGVDRYVSCAGLQLKRVAWVEVSYRWVWHCASGPLGLDRVALRGSRGSQRGAVELGFLEVSLWAWRRRWRRVVGLSTRCRLHVGVLGYVGVLRAGEVRRRLHGLTARVIKTWNVKEEERWGKKASRRGIRNRKKQRKNNERNRLRYLTRALLHICLTSYLCWRGENNYTDCSSSATLQKRKKEPDMFRPEQAAR